MSRGRGEKDEKIRKDGTETKKNKNQAKEFHA